MHLNEVAEDLQKVFYEHGFDRLVLVGVDTVTQEFEALLSDPIRQRVIGHLTTNFKQETDPDILERAGQLAEEDERSTEAALVEELISYTDMGGKGVLGLADTIEALIEQRVDTMLLVEGLSENGSRCQNCDYFATQIFGECPVCSSSDVEDLPDVLENAVEYALLNGS